MLVRGGNEITSIEEWDSKSKISEANKLSRMWVIVDMRVCRARKDGVCEHPMKAL